MADMWMVIKLTSNREPNPGECESEGDLTVDTMLLDVQRTRVERAGASTSSDGKGPTDVNINVKRYQAPKGHAGPRDTQHAPVHARDTHAPVRDTHKRPSTHVTRTRARRPVRGHTWHTPGPIDPL